MKLKISDVAHAMPRGSGGAAGETVGAAFDGGASEDDERGARESELMLLRGVCGFVHGQGGGRDGAGVL